MKILFLGFAKIKYMPYIHFYFDHIDLEKNDVHMVYWNRDLIEEKMPYDGVTYHEFRRFQEDEIPHRKKIINFMKYRRYVRKILKSECFDRIIILHSFPGVLINRLLSKKYAGKFIFDYRDFTYEDSPVFKKIIFRLVEASKATFVSSDSFRSYLPDREKIYSSCNFTSRSLEYRFEVPPPTLPVKVFFWGLIRQEALNRRIIKNLGNDSRFELHYYGREQASARALKSYVEDNGYTNVYFHGEYSPEDRYEFASGAGLLHNIYDSSETMMAIGNKYYDGIIMRIPQLCSLGSLMGELVEKTGVGFACDPFLPSFADDIFEYYNSVDRKAFSISCDAELERIFVKLKKGAAFLDSFFAD